MSLLIKVFCALCVVTIFVFVGAYYWSNIYISLNPQLLCRTKQADRDLKADTDCGYVVDYFIRSV